jgi:hypothetical protein
MGKSLISDGEESNAVFEDDLVFFKEYVESPDYSNLIILSERQYNAAYAVLYGCLYSEFDEKLKSGEVSKNIFDNTQYPLAVLEWGKGGFRKGTIIKDVITGEEHPVEVWEALKKPINIKALNFSKRKIVITKIMPIFKEGKAKIYKVKTKSGKTLYVDENHKFLINAQWKKIKDVSVGEKIAYEKRCQDGI